MKSLKIIGFAVIAIAMLFGFASCGNNAGETPTPEPEPAETPHEHTWDAGEVTKVPTCGTAGVKTYTCTVCGDKSRTEPVPATENHAYSKLTVDSATGIGTKICSACNSEFRGPILKAGGATPSYGGEFQKTLKDNLDVKKGSSDANVTKVVFGLLSDNAIKAKVGTLTKRTNIGGVDGTCYAYAESDGENLIIYIVPKDENAKGFFFNEDSGYMFDEFYKCTEIVGLSLVDTSQVTSMRCIFFGCRVTSLDVSGFDTSQVTCMKSMFYDCSELTSLDVSGFDTLNVTDMSYMFRGCGGLTSLDVRGFDTSNVTDMRYMFYDCSELTSLDVSGFDTSNVTDMKYMFSECIWLTLLDVSGFNTSGVTDLRHMFSNCSSLNSLDVSGFDTSNVTNMVGVFEECHSLNSLDVSKFDTSNVTDMSWMFSDCYGLPELDVSKFNTSQVTCMECMFQGCYGLTSLDFSSFDTSSVTNMSWMFNGCSSLTTIYVADADKVPQNLQDVKPSSATFVTKQ